MLACLLPPLSLLCRVTHVSLAAAVVVEALCLLLAVALGLDGFVSVFAGLLAFSTLKACIIRTIAMNLPGAPA